MSSNEESPTLSHRFQSILAGIRSNRGPQGKNDRAGELEVPPPPDTPVAIDEPYVAPALRIGAAWSWRIIVVVAAAAVILWGMGHVTVVVIPLLIALLISALLSPVCAAFVRIGFPRALAAATTFLGTLALVVGLLTLVGQQLVAGFSELWEAGQQGFQSIIDWALDNPFGLDSTVIVTAFQDAVDEITAWVQQNSSAIASNAAAFTSSAGTFVTMLLLVLFTTFFFLYDGRRIFEWTIKLLPKPARERSKGAALRGWQTLVQYVRVQIFVAFIDAVGIALVAAFLGLPLVIPLGVLVFLASFIPVVGAVATGILAVLIALVAQGFWPAVIMLLGVLAVQQIESNVLQPLIMGKAVSVHPLGVVLAVAAGGFTFGILGALFAVPVVAVLNTMILYLSGRDIFAEAEERNRLQGPGKLTRLWRRIKRSFSGEPRERDADAMVSQAAGVPSGAAAAAGAAGEALAAEKRRQNIAGAPQLGDDPAPETGIPAEDAPGVGPDDGAAGTPAGERPGASAAEDSGEADARQDATDDKDGQGPAEGPSTSR